MSPRNVRGLAVHLTLKGNMETFFQHSLAMDKGVQQSLVGPGRISYYTDFIMKTVLYFVIKKLHAVYLYLSILTVDVHKVHTNACISLWRTTAVAQ